MSDFTPAHSFTDNELRLATLNYEAQEWLVRELHGAFLMSSMTVADVARQLELPVETVEEWLGGDYDLSMAELRQLANALDAHVTYRVTPAYNRIGEWLAGIEQDIWKSQPWEPIRQ